MICFYTELLACSSYGGEEKEKVLVEKPEGKRSLGRPKHRWGDDNNKMDLQEVEVGVRTELSWLRIGTGGRHM